MITADIFDGIVKRMRKIEIATVRASTQYKEFGPENLVDGDKSFGGWISEVGKWQDAWIQFRFAEPARLQRLEVCNGFIEEAVASARDDYFYHLRAADVVILFGEMAGDDVAVCLEDVKEPQILDVDSKEAVATATIRIRGIYRDAPAAEIKPFDVVGLRHVDWYAD